MKTEPKKRKSDSFFNPASDAAEAKKVIVLKEVFEKGALQGLRLLYDLDGNRAVGLRRRAKIFSTT